MNKKYRAILLLAVFLMAYLLVKKPQEIPNSTLGTTSTQRKHPVKRTGNEYDYETSPTGFLPVEKYVTDTNFGAEVIRCGADLPEDIERFLRKGPLPWKVGLDKNKNIVKLTLDYNADKMISFDKQAISKLREDGYEIVQYGFDGISLGNAAFYRQLYLNSYTNTDFEYSTECDQSSQSYDKVEFFPVMVRYLGTLREQDVEIAKQLNGKLIPMMLERKCYHLRDDDYSAEGARDCAIVYGRENTKIMTWELFHFGRNKEEQDMIDQMPRSIGDGYHTVSVKLAAWEKYHGRKYKAGDKFAKAEEVENSQ